MSICRPEWNPEGVEDGPGQLEGLRLAARFDEPPEMPGLLAEPALSRWPAAAARNRRLLLGGGLLIAGVELVRARQCLREELPELPVPLGPEEPPVYVAGHQPLLYHPGVWVKLFAGARAAAASGGRLLNLVVDSDASDLSVPIPALTQSPDGSGALAVERDEPQGTGSPELPLERRPAPDPGAWAAFIERVYARVHPLAPGVADRLHRLVSVRPYPSEKVASFFSRLRRAWEAQGSVPGPANYLEVPISTLSETLAFRLWVLEWASRAEFWREAYNEALRQYRAIHRLRYRANPFPDLERTDDGVEIPFWALSKVDGIWVREPVLVQAAGLSRARASGRNPASARMVLQALGSQGPRTLVELPAGDPLAAARGLAAAKVPLRPKAIPLTLFARLFLGDLFIHGTGGARYESIGDFLLAARWPEAFGQQVPPYAVCSATLRLEAQGAAERAARRQWLEELVRSLRHNPQRIVAELASALGAEAARAGVPRDPDLAGLAARKEELVRQIQSGGDRKALGEAIRRVNGELSRRLAPLADYLDRELDAARKAEALLTERGYPFFLFDPRQLWEVLGADGGTSEPASGG